MKEYWEVCIVDIDQAGKTPRILADLDDLPVKLSRANQGYEDGILDCLLRLAELLETGKPVDPELGLWAAQKLCDLVEARKSQSREKTPKRGPLDFAVFGKQKPGKLKHSEEFRELVAASILDSGLGRHKGSSRTGKSGAYEKASEEFGITPNTAEKYFREFGPRLKESRAVDDALRREQEDNIDL